MEDYHVTLRDRSNGSRWTPHFCADNFAHAEEQALDAVRETPDQYEIINIEKDYGNQLELKNRVRELEDENSMITRYGPADED